MRPDIAWVKYPEQQEPVCAVCGYSMDGHPAYVCGSFGLDLEGTAESEICPVCGFTADNHYDWFCHGLSQ